MSWDFVMRDCGSAEPVVCRSVTMTDKNTEIRVAVVSFRTVVVPHSMISEDLIPHRHWWHYSSNRSDSRAFVSGRHTFSIFLIRPAADSLRV